ncbi:acyl-CoA N-acyltransferase [Clathrospora elynae]|uniref:Acyl-CoA N-acyltransferase n=1 Tax=Clathrospora elynae TaxID=706981 RepID=A0A6A5SNB0_9PLEO|nr:acyl-CoA N-acyltransferase [Clathrospora elynae]
MSTQLPSPFASARLQYRAIRQPQDLAVFEAINSDVHGYQNSNFSNIKLPTTDDATKFMKATAEEGLLGAIIWLPHPPTGMSAEEQDAEFQRRRQNGEIVEGWGTAVGEIHLSLLPPHQSQHRNTEIGLDILPPYQGRGYGSEAINWVLDYAFCRAGLHKVRIRAFGWNVRAIALYERLGFTVEGRERESFWHEGMWWDGVYLGMLEGEWWGVVRKAEEQGTEEEKESS